MRKVIISLISVAAMATCLSSLAASDMASKHSGMYLLGQAGYSFGGDLMGKGINTGGMTGRVGAGYHFNQYFSIESGASYLPQISTQLGGTKLKTDNYAFDITALASYPMTSKLYAFAGGGAVYLLTDNRAIINNHDAGISVYHGSIRPKTTVGFGYKVTHRVALTVSYDHIFQMGHQFPGSFDSVMGGVSFSL